MTLSENICVRENKQSSNEKNEEYYLIQKQVLSRDHDYIKSWIPNNIKCIFLRRVLYSKMSFNVINYRRTSTLWTFKYLFVFNNIQQCLKWIDFFEFIKIFILLFYTLHQYTYYLYRYFYSLVFFFRLTGWNICICICIRGDHVLGFLPITTLWYKSIYCKCWIT